MTLSSATLALAASDGPPFASVECGDLAAASQAWRTLSRTGSAYQSYAFAEACAGAFAARLAVVVARDAGGAPVALLPLQLRRFGPLTVAGLVGGSWANYHMGLFSPAAAWTREDVRALLRAAARAAAIDVFAFSNLPAAYEGDDNPLALLPGRPGPSPAFASALPPAFTPWLDAHFSSASQKKLRKKTRKLESFGPVRHARAPDEADGQRFLDAFFAHKAAQARSRSERDLFAGSAVRDLLRRLVVGGAMEMHALLAGERIVATFGALAHGRRLSGLVVSYEVAAEVAAASPGEWLLIETVRDAVARGFATFDLGVGESRYKREICEVEERLYDAALGFTPLGRLAAALYLAGRSAMGWIKRQPPLLRLAQRLRQFLS